ncbi:MAG TPA: hypothetical protein VG890_14325, partial [Puia sp.]|nr:hypothetical protein [Puia sp.]
IRTPDWVYYQETRYYAVFSVFILQFMICLFSEGSRFFGRTTNRLLRFAVILIIIGELTHGAYYLFKEIAIKRNYGIRINSGNIYLDGLELTMKKVSSGRKVAVCSNTMDISNICSLSGAASVPDAQLMADGVPTSNPILLITIINTNRPYVFPSFFRRYETRLEFEQAGVFYYTSSITPGLKN